MEVLENMMIHNRVGAEVDYTISKKILGAKGIFTSIEKLTANKGV
jgi:hypothetical protein